MMTKLISKNMTEVCVDIAQIEAKLLSISTQYRPQVSLLENPKIVIFVYNGEQNFTYSY